MSSNNKFTFPINSSNFDQILDNLVEETLGNSNENEGGDDGEQENSGSQQFDYQEFDPNLPENVVQSTLDQKVDLLALTKGWNDKNERIIISIGENAASYKWMHDKCSSSYKFYNQITNIILIIFTTSLSAETLIPNNSDNQFSIDIFRRIFTYVSTIVSVLVNFLNFQRLSEKHLNSSKEFSQLYHDIQQQMCMYRRDRHNATKYVTHILKSYDSLILSSPNISNRVIKQFKDTFKNSDISVPDIADRIQKIEIITEQSGSTNENGNTNSIQMKNLTKNKTVLDSKQTPGLSHYGISNLEQIHNVFQIHGDISDKDIQNANSNQLKQLRNKFLKEKSSYEYDRFMNHVNDNFENNENNDK
jgi:hypothetical protein